MADDGDDLQTAQDELCKRNREIAKIRDEVIKKDKIIADLKEREADLLEKAADNDKSVTQKGNALGALEEEVQQLREQVAEKDALLSSQNEEHSSALTKLTEEMEAKVASAAQDSSAGEEFAAKIAEIEAAKDAAEKALASEREAHEQIKIQLQTAESSNRRTSANVIDLQKELEEAKEKFEELEGEREDAVKQLNELNKKVANDEQAAGDQLRRDILELTQKNADLESQIDAQLDVEDDLKKELEDANAKLQDTVDVAPIQEERDQLKRELSEVKENVLKQANSQSQGLQGQLRIATEKLNDLEGRLEIKEETVNSLETDLAEARELETDLRSQVEEKGKELQTEREAWELQMKNQVEQALNEVNELKLTHTRELSIKEVDIKNETQIEVDKQKLEAQQAADKLTAAEGQIAEITYKHDEVQRQFERLKEEKAQLGEEGSNALHESQRRVMTLEGEVDELKKKITDATCEIERLNMSHNLEVERLGQQLQAEVEKSNTAEKIHASKLEEKDMAIGSGNFKAEELEKDLEREKAKVAEKEARIVELADEHDQEVRNLGLQKAEVDKKLAVKEARVLEVEGQLEANRQQQEQLFEVRNQDVAASEEAQMQINEYKNQLALLREQKAAADAENADLQAEHDHHNEELQAKISELQAQHKEALKQAQEGIAEELRQTRERLQQHEAELLTTRQRCEVLQTEKTTLVEEHSSAQLKAQAAEGLASKEREEKAILSLELDQVKGQNTAHETDLHTLREEKREAAVQIEDLQTEVKNKAQELTNSKDDLQRKVEYYDGLLADERSRFEQMQKAHYDAGSDKDSKTKEMNETMRQMQQDLSEAKTLNEAQKNKQDETDRQVSMLEERLQASKTSAESDDAQRRETEMQLRAELATLEAKLSQATQEAQRSAGSTDEQKAKLAAVQNENISKVTNLERQLADITRDSDQLKNQVQEAEDNLKGREEGMLQLREGCNMAAEELFMRQHDFKFEKMRTRGQLEESRRTIRTSILPASELKGGDAGRTQELQKQLTEEQTKNIQQSVLIKRHERQIKRDAEKVKAAEEARKTAAEQLQESAKENRRLQEESRKSGETKEKTNEVRERAHMTHEDQVMYWNESQKVISKLKGRLSEYQRLTTRAGAAKS